MIRAALFDFGGVILSSPFEAFARYERRIGIPEGFIRSVNATNPDDNAWAKLERSEVDLAGFSALFEEEAAALGHRVSGAEVLACLSGEIRPAMVTAVRRCKEAGLVTAILTNNFVGEDRDPAPGAGGEHFAHVRDVVDAIIESSRIGVRKPDPEFYRRACEQLDIEPAEAVFLDDLGINLKPAAAMGMTTIKVVDPEAALDALAAAVGFPVR